MNDKVSLVGTSSERGDGDHAPFDDCDECILRVACAAVPARACLLGECLTSLPARRARRRDIAAAEDVLRGCSGSGSEWACSWLSHSWHSDLMRAPTRYQIHVAIHSLLELVVSTFWVGLLSQLLPSHNVGGRRANTANYHI